MNCKIIQNVKRKASEMRQQITLLLKKSFKCGAFIGALVMLLVGFGVNNRFLENVCISIATGFIVYFSTIIIPEIFKHEHLKQFLKKRHHNFKYDVITLFLRCAKLKFDKETVEKLLCPEIFKTFFFKTSDSSGSKSNLDCVMNGLIDEPEKYSDLRVNVNLFFETTITLATGANIPIEILDKMLGWRRDALMLQQDSDLNQDVKYLTTFIFDWFSDRSHLDETPCSFEHVIDEI